MTSTTLTREIAAEETLGRTLRQFVGSWVALREHKVVAVARTLNALLNKIEGTPVDGVLQISSGHCFLNESLHRRAAACPRPSPAVEPPRTSSWLRALSLVVAFWGYRFPAAPRLDERLEVR